MEESKKIVRLNYFSWLFEQLPVCYELVKMGENVVVSKTFSKVYGMAGMRIGYLIAKPELARKIRSNIVTMRNVYAIECAKKPLKI